MSIPGLVKYGPLEMMIRSKFSSKWKTHYFKVTLDGNIQCYEDEQMTTLKEEMKKRDIKKVQLFDWKDTLTQFEVSFYDKKESWRLKASGEREKADWVSAFTNNYQPVQHDQNYQHPAYHQHLFHMQRQNPHPFLGQQLQMGWQNHYPHQQLQLPPSPRGPPPYPTSTIIREGQVLNMPQPIHPQPMYPQPQQISPRPGLQASRFFNYPNCPLPQPPPAPAPAPALARPTSVISTGDDEEYVMMNNPPVQHQYDYMTPDTDVQSPLQQPSVQNVPQQNEHRMFRSPSVVSDTGSVMSNSDTKEQMSSNQKNVALVNIDMSHEISIHLLSNAEKVGKGNFGEVYKADYKLREDAAPIKVAVKKLNGAKESAKEDMMKEFAVMASMVHPNIVRVYGVVMNMPANPKIVLEYLPHGDLKSHLKNSSKKPVDTLVKYMIDVSMGMHYIAQKGLIHRDLAARNVLVGEGEICKVSDFGLIRELPANMSSYHSSTPVPLPIRWMSPEALSSKCFSEASDVWSYGVLQWEMFNPNELPYDSLDNFQVVLKIKEGYQLTIPNDCPQTVANIMKACWQTEPQLRPNFHQITTILTTKI